MTLYNYIEFIPLKKLLEEKFFTILTNPVGMLVINKHLHQSTAHSDTQNIM